MKNTILLFQKRFFLLLIKIYQKILSPDHGILSYRYSGGFCKFHPTCSQYTYQAIERWGLIKGGIKAIKRVFRCNPFSQGGHDPINPNESNKNNNKK